MAIERPPEVARSEIAHRIPELGGWYLEGESVVIATTDLDASGSLRDAVIEYLRATDRHVAGREADAADVKFRLVAYSFADLQHWRDRLSPWLFELGNVNFVSLNQGRNRIIIGVRDIGLAGQVERAIADADVPLGAVEIVQKAIRYNKKLTDNFRPLVGGVVLARPGDPAADGCTLGFPALQDAQTFIVTAAHCSTRFGTLHPTDAFYQHVDSAGYRVGVEYADPGFFTCNGGQDCRYSDAALVAVDSSVSVDLGLIARPLNRGSSTIDPANPDFTIQSYFGPMEEGDVVEMVGRAGGWRQGTVTGNSCFDARHPDGVILLCQAEADYVSFPGDSGAPIFVVAHEAYALVSLAGVHWGDNHDTFAMPKVWLSYFSPMSGIIEDLGSLEARHPASHPGPSPEPCDDTDSDGDGMIDPC